MSLSPISDVLSNASSLKPVSNAESPKPIHFDPLDFIASPASSFFEGELKKGSHILRLKIQGDWVETERLIPFKTTQDVYFSMIDNHLLFSLDQEKWKSFDEIFSWNVSLDLTTDVKGNLDDIGVCFAINKQVPNIIK